MATTTPSTKDKTWDVSYDNVTIVENQSFEDIREHLALTYRGLNDGNFSADNFTWFDLKTGSHKLMRFWGRGRRKMKEMRVQLHPMNKELLKLEADNWGNVVES
tara:strand:+ start:275 stop:586 length:312 start_codon:yes stop_codon:yes gene_type:complete